MRFSGWQLRAARAAAGLTVRQVSDAAGIATATLTKWELADFVETGDAYRELGKAEAGKVEAVFAVLKDNGLKVTIDGKSITLKRQ